MCEIQIKRLLVLVEKRMKVLEKKDSLTNAETSQALHGYELLDRLNLGQFVTGHEVTAFLGMVK